MAFMQFDFYSKALNYHTTVNVVLPVPDPDDTLLGFENRYPEPGEKYQTLYLLHGMMSDHSGWMRYSNVERYAQAKKLAVVMPNACNSFYTDYAFGSKFYTYYTEELPKILRSVLPLSEKREDNFIAGLSMGGYGALYAALTKPEQYAAAASLSGAIDLFGETEHPSAAILSEDTFKDIYGKDYEYFSKEKNSLRTIAKEKAAAGVELPKLYIACGTEDFLYESNQSGRDYFKSLGLDVTYEEGPGRHEWDFWDPYIRRVIENWLPLKNEIVSDK